MSRKTPPKRPASRSQVATKPRAIRRRGWLLAAAAIVAALCLLAGRDILGWYARRAAVEQLRIGAVTAAQGWLAWSAWLDPGEGKTDLVAAACFRHLSEVDHFEKALEAARRKGAPKALIDRELKLAFIRAGGLESQDTAEIGRLIEAGFPADDVAASFVFGFLFRNEPDEARRVLDAWAADHPEEVAVTYMDAVYWEQLGDVEKARSEFEKTLAGQPRHELARMALARLLEREDDCPAALEQYLQWVTQFPTSVLAQAGLARSLRRIGRVGEARAVLKRTASRAEVSPAVAVEMAQIELESANYDEAGHWFGHARPGQADHFQIDIAAATARALSGDVVLADQDFARADAGYRRQQRIDDLVVRLRVDPRDAQSTSDLDRLASSPPDAAVGRAISATGAAPTAADLYILHCSACHGSEGDGKGRAARHLVPRPRDLRNGSSRLVSTENGLASLEDTQAVIRRGMPGTSMRAFDRLGENEVNLLAEEVLRFYRQGIRERFVGELEGEGEPVDEDEVREVVELASTPAEAVRVPTMGPPDADAIARGKDAYAALGCNKCHGDDGSGAWETPMFDENGELAMPRDLANDPFKGGREPSSIYLRIFLGMPGTPHPSCRNVADDQLIDLVQYCRSISPKAEQELTNHQRLLRERQRLQLVAFDESPPM